MRRNYFIEGLQGAGKTTFVKQISAYLQDYQVFQEGDYSPIELAWCAYVTEKQYDRILEEYPLLTAEIKAKTTEEGNYRIVCYTNILTDVPGFYKDMKKYEIYNGNLDKNAFEKLILERFANWNGEGQIFECSVFQNIIENQMLYLLMSDDEILDFYRRLKSTLGSRAYRIIYLDVEDIPETIDRIRKERTDDKGNEAWFSEMIRYVEESPYGRMQKASGLRGLIKHLEQRRRLEHQIIEEVFPKNSVKIKAKSYDPLAIPYFALG